MNEGQYIKRTTCRLCENKNLIQVLDLGLVPLAGNYLKKEEIGKEKLYPLTVSVCRECSFVQVNEVVDPKELFADYRYLSSIPLSAHFQDYAKEMVKRFLIKDSFVIDIGSNDGVLLKPLKDLGIDAVGVDPAANIAKIANDRELKTIVGYFNVTLAEEIANKYGQADAVFANNVMAHIDDLDEVMRGVDGLLRAAGVFVFEVYYLVDLLQKNQYDIIYHEHHSYHSLIALKPFLARYGFEIFDVKRIPTHSGSIRVYCQRISPQTYKPSARLASLLKFEKTLGLASVKTYQDFGGKVNELRDSLRMIISDLKIVGDKKGVGYGASGRGNMLLNYCQINNKILDYIVDESPERYGRYTPVTHIPIVSPETFRNDNPDYVLLLAWGYKDMIRAKEKQFKDRYIVPLPEVKIL